MTVASCRQVASVIALRCFDALQLGPLAARILERPKNTLRVVAVKLQVELFNCCAGGLGVRLRRISPALIFACQGGPQNVPLLQLIA